MDNNDIFRRLRFIFDFTDDQMMRLFALADCPVSRSEVSDWLKKEDHESFVPLPDLYLAIFLNGFINYKRGKREGPQSKPENTLNNNIIMRKLKIALSLKTEEMLEIFTLADFRLSPHEISAIFRNPKQRQYRVCKDQFLRNFLIGLQIQYRHLDG